MPTETWTTVDIFDGSTWPKNNTRILASLRGSGFRFFGRFSESQMCVYSDLYGHKCFPLSQIESWQAAPLPTATGGIRPEEVEEIRELIHKSLKR